MKLLLGQHIQGGTALPVGCAHRSRPHLVIQNRRGASSAQAITSQRNDVSSVNHINSTLSLKHNRAALRCRAYKQPIVSAAAGSAPPAEFRWGADMKTLGISVGLAVAVWFIPPPAGVTLPAWHLLAIFLGTIVGIITKPLPLGAVAMLGLGATMLTKTLTFAAAFSAFSSEIP